MKWQIYHKDGSLVYQADNLTYSGEWMGDEFVTTKIKSATPIDFQIGDYLEYRGERYTLNVIPTVQKSSRKSSNLEAFVYDGVKFFSCSDELTRCKFLDVVIDQNKAYYTKLPDFSFYALSVEDLADRLKANLDRLYKGENLWTIKVYLGEDNYYTAGDPVSSHNLAGGEKNKPITVSNLSCWEALALVQSEFDLNFVIRNRTIIIGDTGTLLSRYFEYGKDKGLFKIDRTTDDSQQVVTRLRVYGNTTNMPTRYYANLEGSTLPNNLNCQRLMLPAFPKRTLADWAKDPENKDEFTGSYSEDILDPYIDSANAAELGIREATIFFDGKDGEDIYPSIEWIDDGTEAHNPVNVVTVGSDIEDDGLFEDGEPIPDFYITIADIGFDINDYLTEETATISMKDGMCGGREFTIAGCEKVSGGYRLRLQRKEDVGVYYPTRIFKIEPNNKFVLLNISLPKEYVEAASKALLAKAKEWLAKNDYVAYKYSLSVDELFMARQHDLHIQNREESLYNTIKAGSVLRFVDSDLLVSGSITIDRIEIKEGDHRLPQYTINLTEEKSVGTLQRMQQQIDSIAANGGGGGGGYNINEIETIINNFSGKRFLRKDIADSAKEKITFEKGFNLGQFDKDSNGGGAYQDADGNWHLEADYFKVRKKLEAEEVEIMKTSHIGGKLMNTAASCRIADYEERDNFYICYFDRTDGDDIVENLWHSGDQAYCQTFNLINENGQVENQYYWRLVINSGHVLYNGKEYNYIMLSKTDCAEGSTTPKIGDEVVQLGNRSDNNRANAIIQSAVGDDGLNAPYFRMYKGINSYTLPEPRVSMSPEKVSITADEFKLVTDGGEEDVKDLTDNIKKRVDELDKGMEGSFEVWQINTDAELDADGNIVAPNLSSYPSSEWGNEDNPYSEHVGDFLLTKDGICFIFEVTDDYQYRWSLITDKYLIDAVTKIYETQQGLLNTGIDIKGNTITITAEDTLIRTRGNDPIAMFTKEDGHPLMKAEFVDVDNLKVKQLEGAVGSFNGRLESTSTNGRIIIENGNISIFGSFAFPNIKFGIDEDGNAVLNYYNNNGVLLYNLGPDGINKNVDKEPTQFFSTGDVIKTAFDGSAQYNAADFALMLKANAAPLYVFREGYTRTSAVYEWVIGKMYVDAETGETRFDHSQHSDAHGVCYQSQSIGVYGLPSGDLSDVGYYLGVEIPYTFSGNEAYRRNFYRISSRGGTLETVGIFFYRYQDRNDVIQIDSSGNVIDTIGKTYLDIAQMTD